MQAATEAASQGQYEKDWRARPLAEHLLEGDTLLPFD